MISQKVFIASDHAGTEFKSKILTLLQNLQIPNQKFTFEDLGPGPGQSVDYPDFAKKLCQRVLKENGTYGILICGSGIGMSIAANRHQGIRASLIEREWSARMTREHNHANVLCFGARVIAPEMAFECVKTFFETTPSQDERHLRRIRGLDT